MLPEQGSIMVTLASLVKTNIASAAELSGNCFPEFSKLFGMLFFQVIDMIGVLVPQPEKNNIDDEFTSSMAICCESIRYKNEST